MALLTTDTQQVQRCLDELQAGNLAARDELLGATCERLRGLAQRLLRDYERVKRWETTDDVVQNALLRLWTALADVTPRSLAEFHGLAALQIRRELIDLTRKLYGPEGMGANHVSPPVDVSAQSLPQEPAALADDTYGPGGLLEWTEFHEAIDNMRPPEREVFDLLWYQQLTQAQAAMVLGITERGLRKRWRAARLSLVEALQNRAPGA